MATLTSSELTLLRLVKANDKEASSWTKAQIYAAFQAVETRLEASATQTAISGDIETAAPGVFSAPQKRLIFLIVCLLKARQVGLI